MTTREESRYFSVPIELITTGQSITYDLWINSSSRQNRVHYVRIFPKGGALALEDLQDFKKKYFQLYVHEDQRDAYTKSLVANENASDEEKTEVVKDMAITYLGKVFDPDREFTTEVLEEAIQGCRESVEHMVDVVQDYDINELRSLIGNLSFHDFYTYDHSVNVSMYAIIIFKALMPHASKNEMTLAGLSGMLHDIGKLKIPTDLINKAGKLDDEEFKIIQSHPGHGKELIECQNADCPGIDFNIIKRVVYEHHENYNGTGYPNKIAGEDIHILARIVAIADFFDAITTKRSYHEVLSTPDALTVMDRTKGKKLDPKIFDIFSSTVNNFGTGNIHMSLPDSFDPCQPQNELPFVKDKAKKQGNDLFKKENTYGKVKKAS